MSNGAAGCGYEYTDSKYKCGHLTSSGEDTGDKSIINIPNRTDFMAPPVAVLKLDHTTLNFVCDRFKVALTTHHITGHPFRCTQCTDAV